MTNPGPCPHCGGTPTLSRTSAHLYRRDWGPVWECPCGARVGCHPGSTRPLGPVADAGTRAARMAAHAAFDPLWKRRRVSRRRAYRLLAGALGVTGEVHIGEMTAGQAAEVPAAVGRIMAALGITASPFVIEVSQ